jgi:hypothetical protein
MIRSLFTLVAVAVAVAIAFRTPGLYPAAEALWHAFVEFIRATLNVINAKVQK